VRVNPASCPVCVVASCSHGSHVFHLGTGGLFCDRFANRWGSSRVLWVGLSVQIISFATIYVNLLSGECRVGHGAGCFGVLTHTTWRAQDL